MSMNRFVYPRVPFGAVNLKLLEQKIKAGEPPRVCRTGSGSELKVQMAMRPVGMAETMIRLTGTHETTFYRTAATGLTYWDLDLEDGEIQNIDLVV